MKDSVIKYNKFAGFKYAIEKEYEAGIVLSGKEVKAIKANRFEIRDAAIRIENNELYVWNVILSDFPGVIHKHKLLLHRQEINKIIETLTDRTYHGSIVQVLYSSTRKIKLVIGIGRTKKAHAKNASEKRTTEKRILEREMKNY